MKIRIARQRQPGGGFVVFVDVELEGNSPFFGFVEGFEGLSFAGGDDDPGGAGIEKAIEHGFGGGGVILACLASPQADFEASWVRCKIGLIRQEEELVDTC